MNSKGQFMGPVIKELSLKGIKVKYLLQFILLKQVKTVFQCLR